MSLGPSILLGISRRESEGGNRGGGGEDAQLGGMWRREEEIETEEVAV